MATILVVEDEMFIRDNAEWTIRDMGHGALLAVDLAEALSHLSGPQTIDALFVDMRLGALPFGGYDVASQAVAIRPDLRVLYTSGTTLNAEMRDLFVPGGQFLQKPYSSEQLEISVTELLTRPPGDHGPLATVAIVHQN